MPPGHIKESADITGNFFTDTYILIYISKTLDVEASPIPLYTYQLFVTVGQPVNYEELNRWIDGLPLGPRFLQIHVNLI